MNSFLRELQILVPPPSDPKNTKGNWSSIEAEMGLVFPDDYKQFIELYGTGTLCSLIEIGSPFLLGETYRMSVREAWIIRTGVYHQHDQFLESPSPYSYYPEIPGLLPCATDSSGDIIGWLTNVDPELWYLVYRNRENGYFELPEMGFVEFFVAALRGEVPMPEYYFSKEIANLPRVFEPY
jgi:hypothetical protein